MWVDINYNNRPKEAKIYLAKPNKTIISHLYEKIDANLVVKYGNINELNFAIPYEIDGVSNDHINRVKEKMLLKLVLGSYVEWFIIDGIEEEGEDKDLFKVNAFSLGHQLSHKKAISLVNTHDTNEYKAEELLTILLEDTSWSIGEVDSIFDVYRSFEISDDQNVLECILKMGETWNALIIWDTINKTVSFKDIKTDGKFRGLTVKYGNLINSIKRTRNTDEMVTRLYPYGNEGIGINSVNPTGKSYIENFSYFIFPFERNENGDVLKKSDFMSDDLAHVLLDSAERTELYAQQLQELIYGEDLTGQSEGLLFLNSYYVTQSSSLDELKRQLVTAQDLYETANLANDETGKTNATTQINQLTQDISDKQIVVNNLESEITVLNDEITTLQNNLSFEKCIADRFPNDLNKLSELKEELQFYVIEKDWRDENYITEQDLYDGALERFYELQQPKIVVEVGIDNLLNIIEEQYFWDKLVLGDLIKVKYPQMALDFMAKIIEMKYDLTNMEIQITVSNSKDLLNDSERFLQMLYNNTSASTLVSQNKNKWDKVENVQSDTIGLIRDMWDLTKNNIKASVNNSVNIGSRGIVVTDPNNPNNIVVIQSGQISLTEDNGDTWKVALNPHGIIGERIIGKIIAGQNLLITNNSNTFTIDEDGAVFDGNSFKIRTSGTNKSVQEVFDEYLNTAISTPTSELNNKYLTSSELKIESDNITASFASSGGGNGLVNSVAWNNVSSNKTENTKAYADANVNDLTKRNWFVQDTQNRIMSVQNSTMQTLGFGSGIQFSTATSVNTASLEQYVPVIPNTTYTLSWYIDYESVGISDIFEIFVKEYKTDGTGNRLEIISYGTDDVDRNIIRSGSVVTGNNGYKYSSSNEKVKGYESQYITFRTGTNINKLHLILSAQKDCLVTITGLMMSMGGTPVQWSLATGESYNTNVRQDISGIRVSKFDSNGNETNYTQITPDKFSGYYLDEEVFKIDEDETISKKFRALDEITMGSIRILDINDTVNGNKGWAFIPVPRIQ